MALLSDDELAEIERVAQQAVDAMDPQDREFFARAFYLGGSWKGAVSTWTQEAREAVMKIPVQGPDRVFWCLMAATINAFAATSPIAHEEHLLGKTMQMLYATLKTVAELADESLRQQRDDV